MDTPGECYVCGCTELSPCKVRVEHPGGVDFVPCVWVDEERTLCDNPDCLQVAFACPACGISVFSHTPFMEAACQIRATNATARC